MVNRFIVSCLLLCVSFSGLAQFPGGVDTSIILWLKADTGVEEFSGNPAENGDSIAVWRDLSGNSNDATQSVNADKPTFSSVDGVSFDGAATSNAIGDFLDIPDLDPQTFVAVIDNCESSSSGFHGISGQNLGGSSIYLFLATSGQGYQVSFDGVGSEQGRFGVNGESFIGYGENIGTGDYTNQLNFLYAEYQNQQSNFTWLGGLDNGSGNQYRPNLDFKEVVWYEAALSLTRRARIESYLAMKYGIFRDAADDGTTAGIDERDYLASDSTVAWDYSVNSSFHNDVTCLSRDDSSGLNITRQISSSTDAVVLLERNNAFSSDLEFFCWGNDNGSRNIITSLLPAGRSSRLARVWKVDVVGSADTVSISFLLSKTAYTSDTASQYALLIDTDSDFSSGATVNSSGVISGDTLTFENVVLSDGNTFTFSGPVPKIAGGVFSNISLWLKHDAGVEESNGDAAEVNDGIQYWRDQSGNGNDAVQDAAGNRPIFRNGYVEFSGSAANNAIGEFFNMNPWDFQTSIMVLDGVSDGSGGGLHAITGQSNGSPLVYLFISTQALGYTVSFDGQSSATGSFGLNGADRGAVGGNIGTGDFPGTDQIFNAQYSSGHTNMRYLGALSTGSGPRYYPNYNLSEILAYNGTLTDLERNLVESYLAVKYGITKTSTDDGGTGAQDERDYFSSDTVVIWDYSANQLFHQDVAGIGRDDQSTFQLQRGISVNSDAILTLDRQGNFSNDLEFVLWGNNDSVLDAYEVTDLPVGIEGRLRRVWKIQESSTVGSVHLEFDLSNLVGTAGPGTNDLNDVRLLIDTDSTFASGSTTITAASLNNTTDIIQFDHNFTSGTGFYFTLGSVDTSTAPLPIRGLSFSGTPKVDHNLLSWSLSNPKDVVEFVLERSRDSFDYESISKIDWSTQKNYEFQDFDLQSQLYYYRLKLNYASGAVEHSDLIGVLNTNSVGVLISPNPIRSGNQLNLNLKAWLGHELKVILKNSSGQEVENIYSGEVRDEQLSFTISNSFGSGIYFIEFKSHLGSIYEKLIIQN